MWPWAKKAGRRALFLMVLRRAYVALGNPNLAAVFNPWPDQEWELELAFAPDMTGPAFQKALPRTTSSPLVNLRWPQSHLRLLCAWVRADLDLSWGRGLGRSGPANGHRRPLPEGASRFISGRHRSWAIDQLWVVDRTRAGLALSDPHWLSTLKFWGWEPLPTPQAGHEYAVYRLQNLWAHTVDLLCRSDGPITPSGTLLPSDGL